MAPITYRLSPPNLRFHLTLMWMMIGCAVLALAVEALLIWRGGSLDYGFPFLLAPALFLMAVPQLLSISPKRNFMTLDDAGFGYVRLGVRQWWSWQDLPAFSVTARGKSTRVIEFRPPAARGLRSRLARWVVWAAADSWSHRAIRLSDQFDTPLDEIAAALNDYRERAVAGGGASSGPAAGA